MAGGYDRPVLEHTFTSGNITVPSNTFSVSPGRVGIIRAFFAGGATGTIRVYRKMGSLDRWVRMMQGGADVTLDAASQTTQTILLVPGRYRVAYEGGSGVVPPAGHILVTVEVENQSEVRSLIPGASASVNIAWPFVMGNHQGRLFYDMYRFENPANWPVVFTNPFLQNTYWTANGPLISAKMYGDLLDHNDPVFNGSGTVSISLPISGGQVPGSGYLGIADEWTLPTMNLPWTAQAVDYNYIWNSFVFCVIQPRCQFQAERLRFTNY